MESTKIYLIGDPFMKGLTFNLSAILGVFIPISFYCCLSGTILTLIIFPFSIRHTTLVKPIKKLATIFAILWLLNIFATFYMLFNTPKNLSFTNNKNTFLYMNNSKSNKNSL